MIEGMIGGGLVRRALVGVAVTIASFVGLGTVFALWENPFFTRMTPAGGWEIALLAILSLLLGAYVTIRRPACSIKGAGLGGVLGFLGVAGTIASLQESGQSGSGDKPIGLTRPLDDVRVAFDALADTWDSCHGPGSRTARRFDAHLRYLRRTCERLARPRVLDVGTGTGLYLLRLADLISDGVGIDLSERMIDRARTLATDYNLEKTLTYSVANAEDLSPGVIGRFDLILMVGVLEHLKLPERALSAARSLLVPDGEIVVIMRHPWHPATGLRRFWAGTGGVPAHRHLAPRQLGMLALGARLQVTAVVPVDRATSECQRPDSQRSGRWWAAGRIFGLCWPSMTFAAHLVRAPDRNETGGARS